MDLFHVNRTRYQNLKGGALKEQKLGFESDHLQNSSNGDPLHGLNPTPPAKYQRGALKEQKLEFESYHLQDSSNDAPLH